VSARLDYGQQSPDLYRKFAAFNAQIEHSAIEQTIRDLVFVRASQINGCALCVDMHVKAATIHGERPLRLHHLPIWRESPLFDPRERAALEWTEALTKIAPHGVADDTYASVRASFSEKEISDLTFAVMAINAWNRANIAFRTVPGSFDKPLGLDKANLA
jgi:AhpD family alkylhydroperoxidase